VFNKCWQNDKIGLVEPAVLRVGPADIETLPKIFAFDLGAHCPKADIKTAQRLTKLETPLRPTVDAGKTITGFAPLTRDLDPTLIIGFAQSINSACSGKIAAIFSIWRNDLSCISQNFGFCLNEPLIRAKISQSFAFRVKRVSKV